MGEDLEQAPKPHRKRGEQTGRGLRSGTDWEGDVLSPVCAHVCMRVLHISV